MAQNQWHYQRWERKTDNRFYEIRIQPNLWGEMELIRICGGIGKATGNKMHIPLKSYKEGMEKFAEVSLQRKQKHYQAVITKM